MSGRVTLRIIGPKRRVNIPGFSDMMDDLLTGEGDKINELFGKATSSFSSRNQPRYTKTKVMKIALDREVHAGALKYGNYPGNGILSQINHGNDRDILSLPPKKAMTFPPMYKASTSRGRPFSPGNWKKSGEPLWTTRRVHQIIEPRNIDEAVAKRRKAYFPRVARNRFKKAKFWI